MERPGDCHATWISLFLNWGVSMAVGVLVFWFGTENCFGQTEAIDAEYARMNGGVPVTTRAICQSHHIL